MRRVIILLSAIAALTLPAAAREANRPADNAALRYWMAFAQMNDVPISAEDAVRMDAIVAGKAPWDEEKFGPLVEQNKAAIDTMIRGAHLPYCEWGIEYDLGPDAPSAHLPKARALARLNRLYAERLASTGDYDAAIRATVAGIRFSQHMAENASFLGVLTAKVALMAHLNEVQQLAASGHLSSAQLATLRAEMKALPEGGFDWENAAHLEGGAMHDAMLTLSRASDPRALYQTWFGNPPPAGFQVPGPQQIAELDRTTTFYTKLLGMSPDAAKARLPALQKQIENLDAVSRMAVPNPARMIAARAEIINVQHATAEALGVH
jgi:hypothetical protein